MNTTENQKLCGVMTNKEPMWISVEIPTSCGYYRICIGINQEDGHEVSFYSEADKQEWECNSRGCDLWTNMGSVVVKYGVDAKVFDSNHEIIKHI